MSKEGNTPAPSANNGMLKTLFVVVAIAVAIAIGLSVMSFNTASQNQKELQAVTEAISKQTEVLANMQSQASPEELTQFIKTEMDNARRAEMLKPFKKVIGNWESAQPQLDNSGKGTEMYGSEQAEVSIVEFSDFDCPYCKRYHDTPKQVVDQSGNRVNWVWKHFPVHASARPLHVATECVGQQDNRLFWAATEIIFNENGSQNLDPDTLGEMLPIDQEAYQACLTGQEAKRLVQEDYNFGQEAGVTGTPATYVIHNRTNQVLELSGAVPPSRVKAAVKQLIDAARNAEQSVNNAG